MASKGADARSKRAQARDERRAKSSQKEQGQQQEQHEESRSDEGGNGGTSLSTPKLVAAGAAAGALLGTAKAVLDRRHAHGSPDETSDDDGQHEEREREPRGRSAESEQTSSEQPTGVRGLLVSVLEAALDAVQEPGQAQARTEREDRGDERTREEEDDDEEAEREPRAEQTDDGRPAARGESGEAGRAATEGEGDQGADTGAAGGGSRADQESEAPLSRGVDDDRDDEDDDDDEQGEAEPEGRVGERPLDDDAEPIAARNGGGGTAEILERARQQITALVGREPESTSRVEHVDGGWRLAFEVVEVPRIPPTTDVMASYAVALDESGNVLEYGRTQRYYRNRAEGEG